MGADGVAREDSHLAEPHQDAGLDLARSIAKSIAAASMNAPRRKKRPTRRRPERSGGRPKASGAFPDERDPQTLDTTLSRLVSDHGWALDLKVHGVFGRWPAIVGDEVAQHCRPISFTDGRLTVQTDSTAWATQLRLLAPTLVRRLNEELGHGSVTVIDVEGPNLPSWRKGRLRSRDGRGPRDTYG
ncbi:DciA family protein [Nocardioides sp. AE5]|nr:DciA family protein [Nocardioides sp. AE5]